MFEKMLETAIKLAELEFYIRYTGQISGNTTLPIEQKIFVNVQFYSRLNKFRVFDFWKKTTFFENMYIHGLTRI